MKSNVVNLRKPKGIRKAPGIAMGRAMMRVGRKHQRPSLVKSGKALLDQSLAANGEAADQASQTSDPTSSPPQPTRGE
jgi:hypothetical protein